MTRHLLVRSRPWGHPSARIGPRRHTRLGLRFLYGPVTLFGDLKRTKNRLPFCLRNETLPSYYLILRNPRSKSRRDISFPTTRWSSTLSPGVTFLCPRHLSTGHTSDQDDGRRSVDPVVWVEPLWSSLFRHKTFHGKSWPVLSGARKWFVSVFNIGWKSEVSHRSFCHIQFLWLLKFEDV